MSEELNVVANTNCVLVCGKPATGKSASLIGLDSARVLYLNAENGKKLPFRSSAIQITLVDPLEIFDYLQQAEDSGEIDTVVLDSLTFWFQAFETQYVNTAKDSRDAWKHYAGNFIKLMNEFVATSKMSFVFIAHTADNYDENELKTETYVPIKGSLGRNGIEAFFTNVISTKKIEVKKLDKPEYENDLLDITDEDRAVGVKYVFQTRIDKNTHGERIRAPMGMWKLSETFIDNNLSHVINRLNEYYAED